MPNTSKHQQQNDGMENLRKKRKQRKPWCQNMPKPHAKKKQINTSLLSGLSPENIQRAPLTAWNQVLYCVTVLFWMQDDARWCKFTTCHNQKKASAACWALCGSRKVPGGQMNLAGIHLLAAPEVPTITIVEYMLNTCWIPDRSRSCEGPKESKQKCANCANACQTDGVVVPKSGHLRWTLARHVMQTGAWAAGNRERLSNMFKCPTWARHCKKASRESLPHI